MSEYIACDDPVSARQAEQIWMSAMLSTSRADRSAVEAAVPQLYRSLDLSAPRRIHWAEGPRELAAMRENAWMRVDVGNNLSSLFFDKLSHAALTYSESVRRHPLFERRNALIVSSRPFRNTLAAIIDIETAGPANAMKLRRLAARLMGRRRPQLWPTIGSGGHSQADVTYLCSESYLYERHGLVPSTAATLSALAKIVAGVGWIVAHENVCWLVERPMIFRVDAQLRLHDTRGPALAYRDGTIVHAWKGISVPDWMIETPEAITVGRIARERDQFVRRCMIEIMTPERFITSGGARIAARDDTGTLWMSNFGFDIWAAVEVINGTPEPDGSLKHYFLQVPPEMRSARQAVAWTYDMSEAQYSHLTQRT